MNYNTAILPSGLRVIHRPGSSPVVYCGIAVGAGTRHEAPGQEGLAHFCEHLSFKGTARRSALQVINAIEGVGGELNAFTTKEQTTYYCAVTRRHLRQAVDVLCDIVFCSEYPQGEIEKECEVVCDEIESYEDSPAELIYDEMENLLFSGHPLGHAILGTAERVRSYGSSDVLRFARAHYRPDNAVFFADGDLDFDRLVRHLEAALPGTADTLPTVADGLAAVLPPLQAAADPIVRHRATHQAHVMVGTRAFAAADSRRWQLYLLNNMLGGPALNSRLNLALRERRGLVYTVESSMTCYSDTGLWTVYFGCDPADVKRCLRLVEGELRRMTARQLSAPQLAKAKQQLRGQLAIAADNREQYALDFARLFLTDSREHHLDDVLRHIEAITPQQLQDTARLLFEQQPRTTLVYL